MSIMNIQELYKSFGGVMAVADVNMTIEKGEMSAIIGPNGAGKTTLFNLITGYHKPDKGKIIFNGANITKFPPHQVSKLGIGRSFQRVNIFPTMSVIENIMMALIVRKKQVFNMYSFTKDKKDLKEEAIKVLEMIGLADQAYSISQNLSHGEQRKLEIGITLANEPELMLLDEPTAGMSSEEAHNITMIIKKLFSELGKTIIFTEHDIDMVFGTAEKIRVLHEGRIIAEGKPEEISKNEEVKRAYLGG